MNLIVLVIVTFVVLSLGGGLGYLVYLRTRPKKETWSAKVYTLGDGVKEESVMDKDGKPVKHLRLNDLKPYILDTLEKTEMKNQVIYRLQRLKKPTPPVEGDVVDFWGADKREVHVLYIGGTCTLMKKGYDKDIGKAVFEPIGTDKINLLKSEMAMRTDRLQKEKDILQAITPWIVAGICVIGLVAIVYMETSALIHIGDTLGEKLDQISQRQVRIEEVRTGMPISTVPLGGSTVGGG